MRTAAVKKLVELVLESLPNPHTSDVIDDVFCEIERHPDWLQEYNDLCVDLGKDLVNKMGGHWIANSEGRSAIQQVSSKKSTLIESYSRLSENRTRKIEESEALKEMSEYYQLHKSKLPQKMIVHREEIVRLIMAGLSASDAFAETLQLRSV